MSAAGIARAPPLGWRHAPRADPAAAAAGAALPGARRVHDRVRQPGRGAHHRDRRQAVDGLAGDVGKPPALRRRGRHPRAQAHAALARVGRDDPLPARRAAPMALRHRRCCGRRAPHGRRTARAGSLATARRPRRGALGRAPRRPRRRRPARGARPRRQARPPRCRVTCRSSPTRCSRRSLRRRSPCRTTPPSRTSPSCSRARCSTSRSPSSPRRSCRSRCTSTACRCSTAGPTRVRDLPRLSGCSKEGMAMITGFLARVGLATFEPDPAGRGKVVRLTARGVAAKDRGAARLAGLDERNWHPRRMSIGTARGTGRRSRVPRLRRGNGAAPDRLARPAAISHPDRAHCSPIRAARSPATRSCCTAAAIRTAVDPPLRPPQPRPRRPAVHDGHRQRHARLVLRQGATATPDRAIARGLELAAAGAGIVDVGGMTAQPGRVLTEDEEIARVEPVVRALRAALGLPISVDTYRAGVADAALARGRRPHQRPHRPHRPRHGGGRSPRHGAGLVVTHLGLRPNRCRPGATRSRSARSRAFLAERAAAAVRGRRRRRRDPGRSRARVRQGHRHRPGDAARASRASPASAIRSCSRRRTRR